MPSRRLMLIALMLPLLFAAFPGHSEADGGSKITGVWLCDATRPGSLVGRPITFVFHDDGAFSYSSQTTVNGGPLALPFTSRAGGYGEWEKTGHKTFAYRARENMYISGNAGGFFYVDSTQRLVGGQLCSGRAECPGTETRVRLTQFTFAPDGSISGEIDLLPANSTAQTLCERLNTAFPGLP